MKQQLIAVHVKSLCKKLVSAVLQRSILRSDFSNKIQNLTIKILWIRLKLNKNPTDGK